MRRLLAVLALVAVAGCDTSADPDAYGPAGDHSFITVTDIPTTAPGFYNVAVVIEGLATCSSEQRSEGACVTSTLTFSDVPASDATPDGFTLPADDPEQFVVGREYTLTLQFYQGDESIAVYLMGYSPR